MTTHQEPRDGATDDAVVAPPPPPGGYAPPGADVARRGIPADSDHPPADGDATNQWMSSVLLVVALVLLTHWIHWWGLIVIAGLVLMIFLHELGHYVMAKRAGMKVTEFFLGFGPRLWSFRRGETEYGLKLLPLGAYVKIIGMNNLDEVDPADEARAYRQKPFRDRLAVAVAGSAMHFVQALILIFILLAAVGVQGGSLFSNVDHVRNWKVHDVSAGSAAAAAGLQQGDRVEEIGGVPVDDFEALHDAVADRADQPVEIVFEHSGQVHRRTVTLGHDPDDPSKGILGITATLPSEKLSLAAAVPQTFRDFGTVAKQSVVGLGQFFSPSGISDFYHQLTTANDKSTDGPTVEGSASAQHSSSGSSASSPSADENRVLSIYGVFRITTSAAETAGITAAMSLFILINVFIGIFNLIPLLPFDGGHVVVAVYEKVQEMRRKQRRYFADVSRLLPITYVVVLVLAGLFASTLYLDIVNPVTVN